MESGLPKLLDLFDDAGIGVTCFCTGEVAERFPDRIRDIVARGHELACHGHTHRRFDRMSTGEAAEELRRSTDVLRAFGTQVTSFRAPNLQLPNQYLPLLEETGFAVDSSQGKHKIAYYRGAGRTTVRRFPASTTSSVLRLPPWFRDRLLGALAAPTVLFVHPWEFVDLTRERLRLDCRFRTGEPALRDLKAVIALFKDRGARFVRMNELPALVPA